MIGDCSSKEDRGSVQTGLVLPVRFTTDRYEMTKDVIDLVRVMDDRESLQFGLAELHDTGTRTRRPRGNGRRANTQVSRGRIA